MKKNFSYINDKCEASKILNQLLEEKYQDYTYKVNRHFHQYFIIRKDIYNVIGKLFLYNKISEHMITTIKNYKYPKELENFILNVLNFYHKVLYNNIINSK